jgi:DNA repair protein RadC
MDGENGNAAVEQGQRNGQGTGTPPGQQGGENKPETINMTSEQLAERLSRAEGSALTKLFEGLGVKNADELKALLTNGKSAIEAEEKRKNDELSATEKLQKQIDKLTEERDTALAAVETMKQEARIQTRNTAVMEAAKEAVNPKDVLRWAEAEMKETLEKVLGEDGAVDDKVVK